MQDFRQLLVWQRAHDLSLAIKQAVRSFLRTGYTDLKTQILRASDSVVSNIVEGCGAATRKEFARYLDISIKSACEVDYRLQLARDDGCLSYSEWRHLFTKIVEIRKMLFALRKAVLAADNAERRHGRDKPTPRLTTDNQRPTTRNRLLAVRLFRGSGGTASLYSSNLWPTPSLSEILGPRTPSSRELS